MSDESIIYGDDPIEQPIDEMDELSSDLIDLLKTVHED